MRRLPLFPLGSVLVPGLVLPLHVFEPRYRRLVADLLARPENERVFGVVAIKEGHEVGTGAARALYSVGCTALLAEATRHEDGRFDLVTSGVARFRLDALDETAGTPYLTGLVSVLPDPDGDDAHLEELAETVRLRFAAYRQRLGAVQVRLPSSPGVLSYLVAAAMVLHLPEQQSLLEEPDSARRLLAERHLLDRELLLLDRLAAVPAPHLGRTAQTAN